MPRITYLGPQGTFTEAALLRMVERNLVPAPGPLELVATESTAGALQAVRDGTADFACAPIENSIEGSIKPTLESLAGGTPLQVFAELTLDVEFSIVVKAGRTVNHIHTVAAFPTAAGQVRHWLAEHLPRAEVVPANSNASAALDVAYNRADAGVTTKLAAERYELVELATGVVDEVNARTKFVLVGTPGRCPPRTGADRTAVVLKVRNEPSGLVSALTEFSVRDVDLTRIESHPTRTNLGAYLFFVDCIGHIEDSAVAEALKALHRRCDDMRFLGSWPTESVTGASPPNTDEAERWFDGISRREGQV